MTKFSSKTALLTVLILAGSLASGSAHANILRTADGVAVRSTDGNCVLTGTDGAGDAGCPNTTVAAAVDSEKTVYFDYNSSKLTAHAKHHLDHLAHRLRAEAKAMGKHAKAPTITIVGYADRMGSASYNEKLALRRARSVRAYLLSKGVHAKKVVVRSLGKTEPKADCSADLPRKELIQCLREDRRVEIEVGK